jgi:hypothetical protein
LTFIARHKIILDRLVYIRERMDSRSFKKHKKIRVGDLYTVKIQILVGKLCNFTAQFQFPGQCKIHQDHWV